MADLTPIVTPNNEATGVVTGISPTAIFEKAMESGSITTSSCFLVEISKVDGNDLDDYISNSNTIEDVVPAEVEILRINLLDEDEHTALDYGADGDSGEQYRTKITINPDNLLKPNTNYATLLSKELSTITVFDPEPNAGNTGDGELHVKGPYNQLAADTYTILVNGTGLKGIAEYTWSRLSDGHLSSTKISSGQHIALDRGMQIKFGDGTFTSGDSYIIRVVPQDNLIDIYSWTFSSGSGNYEDPDDSTSDTIIDYPIASPVVSDEGLKVVSISPGVAESQVKIARKSYVAVGNVTFTTKDYVSTYNDYTIQYLAGGTAGAEAVNIIDTTKIQITIEDGVSTAQQIITAFEAHALATSIDAESESLTSIQSASDAEDFSTGVDTNKIIITFNKDIDEASLTSKIKITTQDIFPASMATSLDFTTSVTGSQLTITLLEQ